MKNAHQRVGRGKLAFAKHGRGAMGLKMSNKARLDLTKSGLKDLLKGIMKENRKKARKKKKK